MAGEWKKLPVAEAPLEIIDGDRGVNYPKQEDFGSSGDCLFLNTGNVSKTGFNFSDRSFITKAKDTALRKGKLKRHDVVLTTRGTVGNVALFDDSVHFKDVRINSGMVLLRADQSKLLPRYLFLFVRSPLFKEQVAALTTGSAQPQLPIRDIRRVEITLPPLAEQKSIAAVLGALDDKIELNRRMNATLEAMARALFQSWFVDFDPVRAKLDGRTPAALDPVTAALFPEHFAHGEHDMLPVGWRHAAIEEVCAINSWTLNKNDDMDTLEYVEISEVSRGNIANIATYARGAEPSRARRRLRHGDTVLSTVRPDRGSYFLALNPPENRVASTGFAVLTPKTVPWSFIHAALTQPEVSDHLGQMADGGAYPAVRPEIIGAMQVVLPNEPKILEAFQRICAPLFEQAEANRTESRTLVTMRDTLLPKLLSGKLTLGQTPI
jgi:type I restriction enzyme, S subunit